METYTKIKPAGLTKLNNAEYTNFMNAFQRLASLPEGGGGDSESPDEISLDNNPLGITDAQKAAFEKELALMTDLVSQSRISDETAHFVNELNALIDETTALYNQRVGAAKATAKRKE